MREAARVGAQDALRAAVHEAGSASDARRFGRVPRPNPPRYSDREATSNS